MSKERRRSKRRPLNSATRSNADACSQQTRDIHPMLCQCWAHGWPMVISRWVNAEQLLSLAWYNSEQRRKNRDRCWPGWRRLKDGKKSVMLARHSVVVKSMPSPEVYSINQHQQPRVSAMGGKKGGPKVYWISNRWQNPKQFVVGVVVVHTTGRHL